ncbi:MAG: extracellular solute-binding protein [Propionibacteriales bacterium]|nr:extracellular solute-binding protein [Propionibacteriales bacterium]
MGALTRRELLRRAAYIAPTAALWPALLTGCSEEKQSSGSAGGGSLDILVGFGTGNAPEQIRVQEELAKSFEASGGSPIAFRRIPDGEAAQRQLGVLIAAGTPPDIILPTGVYGISLYLDQNIWLDLAPMLRDANVDLNLFVDAAVTAAKAPNYYGPDSDVIVGLPDGVFTHTIAYNKDLFAAAGLDEPPHQWNTAGWDYDALLAVTKALTLDSSGRSAADAGFSADDIVQFGLGHWDTGLMALGYGAQKYDPQSRRLLLDSPENIAGTQFGADLVNVHHVLASDQLAAGVAAGADDPQLAAWKSGKIAIIDMCGCDLQTFGLDNQFEWDVAAWPKGPERLVSTLNLDVGAIVAAGSQPEAAFEALRYLLVEPDNARRLSTKGYGAMSPLRSEQSAFLDELKGDFPGIDLQLFLEAFPFSVNQEGWFPAFTEVGDLGGQFLDPIALGTSTAAEQLPLYQQAAQKLVDRWFQENELPS